MSKSRTSKKVINNVSTEVFEESLSTYAVADAKEAKINAIIDEKVTKIREQYASDLSQCAEDKEKAFEVVQTYCEENKEALFAKKRSMETVHGSVGFRTGTPALKTLKGFTWGSVLSIAKTLYPSYIRTKEELNKELILAEKDIDEVKVMMPKIGIEMKQDEAFFIDLKKESPSI